MPLKLALKAGEKIVINGAVFSNVTPRSITLELLNFAHVMRETDIMQEEEANTPVKRAYYMVQAMLLNSDGSQAIMPLFQDAVGALKDAIRNSDMHDLLDKADQHVRMGDYYKAIVALRSVIRYESLLLS